MMTDEELLEARKRSREWREMVEEYCPNGGALLGDFPYEDELSASEVALW
jgi:hypothetical protein